MMTMMNMNTAGEVDLLDESNSDHDLSLCSWALIEVPWTNKNGGREYWSERYIKQLLSQKKKVQLPYSFMLEF